MNERVFNTHSKGERVKIPLLPKQSKIKGAGQRQWSRQGEVMIGSHTIHLKQGAEISILKVLLNHPNFPLHKNY